MIYFRDNQNQWRIKDLNSTHGMDLNNFYLPLDDLQKKEYGKQFPIITKNKLNPI